MKTKEYKYDVAFSFCAKDENIATEINDLIQDRIKTFLYSKNQEEIAGTDGEETFNKVFGEDARIVFVLYRQEWGTTSWTRVEETAIRNRAFEEGFDFTIFAPLEKPQTVPEWLPKTRIWYGMDRWGVEGAASVIEARVQEFGGKVKEETVEDRAAKLSRALKAEKEKQSLLNSDKGVKIANKEVSKLFTHIESAIKKVAYNKDKANFIVEKKNKKLAVFGEGFTIQFFWTASFINTLKGSALYMTLYKGHFPVDGRDFFPFERPQRLIRIEFNFDISLSGSPLWTKAKGKKESYSTSDLAKLAITMLFDKVHKSQSKIL